jgi:type I restriction-modification system DNA methylase subunit
MRDTLGNKKHSAVFTPKDAADFMADSLLKNWSVGKTILDPACGSGNLLIAVAEKLLKRGVNPAAIANSIYGYDIQQEYVDQCRKALFDLLGHEANIQHTDFLIS